jgi:hypothetical protein
MRKFNEFQGVRYVRLLSNQKDSLRDLTIYNPGDVKTADVVYTAQNCLHLPSITRTLACIQSLT